MKKALIGILGVMILLGAGKTLTLKSRILNHKSQINNKIPITKAPTTNYQLPTTTHRSLFIPYWSSGISEDDLTYENFYYFGIVPTATGEIENEVGLSNMPRIVESLKSKVNNQKKLALRMLDASVTESILTNIEAQKTLSKQLNSILEKYSFTGIVLDLEVPFTLQAEKKWQITKFVQTICSSLKQDYKTCSLLIYGDFSYRNRPYDLKELGKVTDSILLMAYDFHKAGGEPGPNFPFYSGSNLSPSLRVSPSNVDYGYSFKQMVTDALALVPREKIEVVFGMYGYDWTLNEQGKPLKSAKAVSVNEIKSKVLKSEGLKVESNGAKEKSIEYVDIEGRNHVIWYEDEESAAVKTKYLLEQGISRVSFWAQSYF